MARIATEEQNDLKYCSFYKIVGDPFKSVSLPSNAKYQAGGVLTCVGMSVVNNVPFLQCQMQGQTEDSPAW